MTDLDISMNSPSDPDKDTSAGDPEGAGHAPGEGVIDHATTKVQDAIERAADGASYAVGRVSGRLRQAYVKAAGRAQQTSDAVEPFVKDRPYAALSLAMALGVIVGLHIGGRGPRVIYVRAP